MEYMIKTALGAQTLTHRYYKTEFFKGQVSEPRTGVGWYRGWTHTRARVPSLPAPWLLSTQLQLHSGTIHHTRQPGRGDQKWEEERGEKKSQVWKETSDSWSPIPLTSTKA